MSLRAFSRVASFVVLGGPVLFGCATRLTRDPAQIANAGPYNGACTANREFCAYFTPSDMPIHAVREYLANAKRKIRIATYNFSVHAYQDVLEQKLREGVEVEFLLDYKHSLEDGTKDPELAVDGDEEDGNDNRRREPALWNRLKGRAGFKLTKYRIPVMRGLGPQMHNKIILIDDEVALFGSANFTYTGLVGNFENVLAVRDRALIAKFTAEVDEMKAYSKLACETFVKDPALCGTGEDHKQQWEKSFKSLVATGKFPAGTIKTDKGCGGLGFGLVDAGNQPNVKNTAACFVDAALGSKYQAFVDALSQIERYTSADGTSPGKLVKDDPVRLFPVTARHRPASPQTGVNRLFFGPEDDIEGEIVRALEATLKDPLNSFAYLSTNFITSDPMSDSLVKMKKAGVHMQVFFDRGRMRDPQGNFAKQLEKLKGIISEFDNQLSGGGGANHNKFGVIYSPESGLVLLNGSANWSKAAVERNDENLLVSKDKELAFLYLREVLAQVFVYIHGGDEQSEGWRDELTFLSGVKGFDGSCLKAVLAIDNFKACRGNNHRSWEVSEFRHRSSAILSVKDLPFAIGTRRAWAWVPNLNDGTWVELFSSDGFEGKWVTAIPAPPGTDVQFKFFDGPMNHVPSPNNFDFLTPEYFGAGNDRMQRNASLSIFTVRDSNLLWGKR